MQQTVFEYHTRSNPNMILKEEMSTVELELELEICLCKAL